MHRDTDCYPGLYSIIVYPGPYRARTRQRDALGFVQELDEPRAGESTMRGAIVLSWRDVLDAARGTESCHNVAVHEFAHQLDGQDGEVEGTPILPDSTMYAEWARVLGREFEKLREDSVLGRPTLLRAYGAKNPAEFFAVATECFFTRPGPMQREYPELYEELRSFYRLDTASLMAS
jgi:Mlc titration factor MtfA (ptsG expression regulator)